MKQLDEKTFVSPQIMPSDMPAIAASGVTMIVNNRPDGEEPGQPLASQIEAAAAEAGVQYRHLPVGGAGLSATLVEAMAEALDAADGKVLAFCRSGTRSTYLWALARAQAGDAKDEIVRKAEAAGYDLVPIAPYLEPPPS